MTWDMRRIARLFDREPGARDGEAKAGDANDVEALRADIAALETELADQTRRLEAARSDALAFEQQAIEAIRAGDDRSAREALIRQRDVVDAVGVLEADIQVLREALAELSRFVECSTDGAAAGPAPAEPGHDSSPTSAEE